MPDTLKTKLIIKVCDR